MAKAVIRGLGALALAAAALVPASAWAQHARGVPLGRSDFYARGLYDMGISDDYGAVGGEVGMRLDEGFLASFEFDRGWVGQNGSSSFTYKLRAIAEFPPERSGGVSGCLLAAISRGYSWVLNVAEFSGRVNAKLTALHLPFAAGIGYTVPLMDDELTLTPYVLPQLTLAFYGGEVYDRKEVVPMEGAVDFYFAAVGGVVLDFAPVFLDVSGYAQPASDAVAVSLALGVAL